jgi:hypothetical protein
MLERLPGDKSMTSRTASAGGASGRRQRVLPGAADPRFDTELFVPFCLDSTELEMNLFIHRGLGRTFMTEASLPPGTHRRIITQFHTVPYAG